MNRPAKKERYLSALIKVRDELKDFLNLGSLLQNHENSGKLPILLKQAEMNAHSYIQA